MALTAVRRVCVFTVVLLLPLRVTLLQLRTGRKGASSCRLRAQAELPWSLLCISGFRGTRPGVRFSDSPGSLCPGVISEGCFFAFSFESCGLVSKMMKGW